MKKSLLRTALAALALAFLFAACKNQSTPESNSGKTSKTDPTPAKSNEIPLTLEALNDNTTITLSRTDLVTNFKYSIDGGELKDVSSSTPVEIPLSGNSCISFYGEGTSNTSSKYFNINCSADCYVYGNVMSLLSSDFKNKTEITQNYAFYELFYYNIHIKKSPQKELLLPATTLASYCYGRMFYFCTSLTAAPALPATSLADYCYAGMFYFCTSLTAAPDLPATNLADRCYDSMFRDCVSLTAAPALPATSLEDYCYINMFNGCTSLETAPALPATSLAKYCYLGMFNGCTSLETAPDLSATSLADYCYAGMFYGCTSLTKAPDLPATNLADYCYYNMFYGCTSLTAAPVLPATSLAEGCYQSMFFDCTSLNSVKCLATDISAKSCLTNWLSGVASTGTFVKSPSASWAVAGQKGIPSGWTVQTAADN